MPIQFDIPTYSINETPPKYRLVKFLLYLKYALSAITWRMGLWQQYQSGSTFYNGYSPTASYGIGVRVQWAFSVYESLTAANMGNNPLTSPDNWILANQYVLGSDERVLFNAGYTNYTYDLNRYFKLQLTQNGFQGFRQPPYPAPYGGGSSFSDIYITNVAPVFSTFVVGATELTSSAVGASSSQNKGVSLTEIYTDTTSYGYVIHFPLAVFNSLGATDSIRTAVVRQFADTINPSGLRYSIVTY